MVFRFILEKILFLLELTGLMVAKEGRGSRHDKYAGVVCKKEFNELLSRGKVGSAYDKALDGIDRGILPPKYVSDNLTQSAIKAEHDYNSNKAKSSFSYAAKLVKGKYFDDPSDHYEAARFLKKGLLSAMKIIRNRAKSAVLPETRKAEINEYNSLAHTYRNIFGGKAKAKARAST